MKKTVINKIKILHVHAGMNHGGVEATAMNILRHIDRERFSFVFLCLDGRKYDHEDELVKLGAKIVRTPAPRSMGLVNYIKAIRQIMREEKIDIVHAHSNMVLSFIAAKSAGVKARIAHSHTTGTETVPGIPKKILIFISKIIINLLSTCRIACSNEAGTYLFGSRPFVTYSNGIILDNYRFSKKNRIAIRKGLTIPDDATVIGHVGRMVPVKNQTFLIQIFEHYLKLAPNSHLLLIGEGCQKHCNEQYVKSRNISDNVHFLGARRDIGDIYSAMDLFVLPSINEGLGMVIIEAQVNGLRSLVSDSVPQAVDLSDGVEFYSLKNSPSKWASKIYSMNLSRFNAKNIFKTSPYNIEISVKDIENLYTEARGNK